jgi:hypothetical protein
MRRHWAYLKYLVRHKWFVFLECLRLKVPVWRGLVHDLSKFRPSEWFPYAKTFYAANGAGRYENTHAFHIAWNKHQHRNEHHWQYWLLTLDQGTTVALQMPEAVVREMVADWIGAGKAINGKRDVENWYEKNKNRIILHKETRVLVETLLRVKSS